MPRLNDQADMDKHAIGETTFTFQGTRLEKLGATEYTLVTVAVDVTGSVNGFEDELRLMIERIVEACQKSPRSDNLLLRVITFSTTVGINEIHGFKLLSEIDASAYPDLDIGGLTPLCDAAYSSIGAMVEYGERLRDNDYLVNAIAFIVTDGGENASESATERMIKELIERANREEKLESLVSILVGINAQQLKAVLTDFKDKTGIDKYIDAGNATKSQLAKLAEFVSRSISSQSQAVGTGGPSQNIAVTI